MNTNIILRLVGILLILIVMDGCLQPDPLNQPFSTFQPVDIEDGLTLSDPATENVEPDALREIYYDMHDEYLYWQFRSMLVFRNGKLIAESYMKDDADRTKRHLIWSCTKQFMGVLTGMAISEGLIEAIKDPVSKYMPESLSGHPDKAGITIRNLLMMQSGIDYSNDGTTGQTDKVLRQIPDDITQFVLDRPVYTEPGKDFNYNDGDPQLMSAVIQTLAGIPTDEWADKVLFSKIGLRNYNWVRYRDGVTLGGFGIETTPREMAKLALCIADEGRYKEDEVIETAWLEEMTSEQVEVDDDYSFGYYWWIDRNRDIRFMWGHGGQFAFIVPAKSLVVVMTSLPNTQGKHQISGDQALEIVYRIMDVCI